MISDPALLDCILEDRLLSERDVKSPLLTEEREDEFLDGMTFCWYEMAEDERSDCRVRSAAWARWHLHFNPSTDAPNP